MEWFFIAPVAGLASIALAVYLFFYVNKQDSGTPKMQEISAIIKEASAAYLKRQNKTLAVFVLIMAIILGTVFGFSRGTVFDYHIALAYVFGSSCTSLASYFGMMAALSANVRTANAARKGLRQAFPVALYGGAVMGLSMVGLSMLGISTLYFIYGPEHLETTILTFSLGASVLATFAKVGGGIFTKTADIGADLVGKVELGLSEDDPRNPAVIADNVGDNVGDVAGMGADLTDSYIASVTSAMIIGWAVWRGVDQTRALVYATLPLLIAAGGIFAAIFGVLFMRVVKKDNPGVALNRGTFLTCFIFTVLSLVILYSLGGGGEKWGVFYATITGLIAGIVIGLTSDYYTSIDRKPVLRTAEASQSGTAINILTGFSYGVISIVPSTIGISVAILASWYFAGLYGVGISAVGMLSIAGMIISADAYGPIVDNAKGIAEQSGLGKEVVEVADRLDAAGNTAKAITKGFAICSAALTVLAMFVAYAEIAGIEKHPITGLYILNFINSKVIAGVFIGAMIPPLVAALLILAVGRNSFRMVEEIRRQFKEIPGLMEGKAKPEYAKCVDIATKGALKELLPPIVLVIVVPLAVGLILGKEALGGTLLGSIITGNIFALFMANAGGAWDNAKKYIEAGGFGGAGSEAHKASVVGDTVGDPFKDTAGPSLNNIIAVMSRVAAIFAPIIAVVTLFPWI